MASIFGAAFDKLEKDVQRELIANLMTRKKRYMKAMGGGSVKTKVILLGDTPGPGRPTHSNYHHTPFYSTKNSSLWVNCLLRDHRIPECDLLWFNTTLADGTKLDASIVKRCLEGNPVVISLGGNAKKWLEHNLSGYPLTAGVFHPQAWKRFHSKEHYPLIDILEQMLDLNKVV